ERKALMQGSLVAGVYEKTLERESAYELLKGRAQAPTETSEPGTTTASPAGSGDGLLGSLGQGLGGLARGSGRKDSLLETLAKSAARTIGSTVGREIIRGVLGGLLGGGKRR
ncbi:MAG: ATP-binding protein, partial [Thiomonas sp. 20-64-5]